MGINKEDRELIRKLLDLYNKGQRIKSQDLTNLYNRVFDKNLTNTTCSTCLRLRLFELSNALDKGIKLYKARLTDEDIEFLKWTLTLEEDHFPSFEKVCEIYNRVFNLNRLINSCLKCLRQMLSDLYELLGNL